MREVIIWGTGSRLRKNKNLFNNMEILYYCDSNIREDTCYIDGIMVISPGQIIDKIKEHPGLRIIIASVWEMEIYIQCVNMGIGDYVELFYIDSRNAYSYDENSGLYVSLYENYNENINYLYDKGLSYYAGIYNDYKGGMFEHYKREFLPCGLIKKDEEKVLDKGKEQIFALKAFEGATDIEVKAGESVYSKMLDVEHFEYFKKDKNEILYIKPNKNILISRLWDVYSGRKGKLVLHIVCDSLAQDALQDRYKEIMPNTYRYFGDGVSFGNCYCCTDWTLPGIATIETGKYPVSHQLLHPQRCGCITGQTLFEKFHEKGWFTACIGSNWRAAPEYGYLKGLDRMVYVHGLNKGETLELLQDFIEMVRGFRDKDLFITLYVYDLHHNMKNVPDIGEQLGLGLEHHFYTEGFEGKSVFADYHISRYEQYIEKLKKLDYYLGILYGFLDKEYGDSCKVVLSSDHGTVAPLELDLLHKQDGISHRLADRMVKVPVFIKASGISKENITEVIDNTELHKIVSLFSGHDDPDNEIIHTVCRQGFAYNESIYPGQTYVAEIIDEKYHFYFETEELVNEECLIPDSSFKARLFERESGSVIEKDKFKKTYIGLVQQHIGKQGEARRIKTQMCQQCRKWHKNKCAIPSYIEKGI